MIEIINKVKVYFDNERRIKKLIASPIIASESNITNLCVYSDFDITDFGATVMVKRADGLISGEYAMSLKIDDDGNRYFNYVFDNNIDLAIAGPLALTVRFIKYQFDEELEITIPLKIIPLALINLFVLEAVSKIDESDFDYLFTKIENLKGELHKDFIPKDYEPFNELVGNYLNVEDNVLLLAREDDETKRIKLADLRKKIDKYLGLLNENSIELAGLFTYGGINRNGIYSLILQTDNNFESLLIVNQIEDNGVLTDYQLILNSKLLMIRKKPNIDNIWGAWKNKDWGEIIDDLTELNNYVLKDFNNYDEIEDVIESTFLVNNADNEVKKLKIDNLIKYYEDRKTEYGVRWVQGQSNPKGERVMRFNGRMIVGDATGLNFRVGTGNAIVNNSFDNIKAFEKEMYVKIDGNSYTKFPHILFFKDEIVVDNGITYEYKWVCMSKLDEDYRIPAIHKRPDGSIVDEVYISSYEGFIDFDNKLKSLSGKQPTVEKTADEFLNAARNNDGLGVNSKYTIQDIIEIGYLQHRWAVMLGTKNVQDYLLGATSMPYSNVNYLTIGNLTNVNYLIMGKIPAEDFRIGMTISAGTSYANNNVFANRVIVEIEYLEDNTKIIFDGTIVASIPAGTVVSARAWRSGMLNDCVASSGFYIDDGGKTPIKIEGIENPFGNIYKHVAGIKIFEDGYYITDDISKYNWNFDLVNYNKLNYNVPKANGWIVDVGFDEDFPFANFPISVNVSGNSSTYYCDYFYQDYKVNKYRTALYGGAWQRGFYFGLYMWVMDYEFGESGRTYGARLSYRP